MSLAVKWYDAEQTILIATIAKDTSWVDYHSSIDEIILKASQTDHRIDVIYYDEVGMPAGNPMPHLKQGIGKLTKQGNIRLSVIAGSRGSSGFVRAILESIGKMFMKRSDMGGNNFGGFVKTLDEAVALIYADRAKTQQLAS